MTYLVLVEPAQDQRSALAIWLLEHEPDIRTASPTGFHVPAALFKDVPEALLVGALVDGHAYRHVVDDVPLTEIRLPVNDGARPEPLTPKPRRARKRVSQHPTGAAVTAESRQVPTGKAAEK